MKKISLILLSLVLVAVPVLAKDDKEDKPKDDPKKVFVCKYVGKPGVDERLQTGQNPINVSVNSIKDYQGVGSYFNDAQGRSYVLAEDTGQPEPDVSECPDGDTPDGTDPTTPKNPSEQSNPTPQPETTVETTTEAQK